MRIVLANLYGPFLGARFREDGEASGQEFREDYILPALHKLADGQRLVINIDATSPSASFLEECFGGLIRVEGLERDLILAKIVIEAESEAAQEFKKLAMTFIDEAEAN